MAFFNITSSAEFSGATVIFPDGTTQTIASDNPNYEAVRDGLLAGSLTDDQLLDLIAPFEAIYKSLTKLTERISRKGSKLLFDGDPVHNALTDFIIGIMNEGGDETSWRAYANFMEKLYTNPSETSRKHLFHFITANGLQVTADGDIVLYKGTREDGKSTRSGYGIVNGVEFEDDYLQNEVGAVIEIPRSRVDESRDALCSVGLHVGAFEYVTGQYSSTWPRMWVVLVNPRDVVAVPHDFQSSKIRVTRYRVIEELGRTRDAKKHEGIVYTPPAEAPVEAPTEPVTVKVTPLETPAAITVQIDTAKGKVVYPEGSRVPEYKALIQDIIRQEPQTNLKRYRSKRITAGRRDEFTQAADELGFKL